MSQILSLIIQYKEVVILIVALIFSVIFYGKKKVEKFVLAELSNLEKSVIDNVKANPITYVSLVYSKLPVSLKTFATIKMISTIVAKFLDK